MLAAYAAAIAQLKECITLYKDLRTKVTTPPTFIQPPPLYINETNIKPRCHGLYL